MAVLRTILKRPVTRNGGRTSIRVQVIIPISCILFIAVRTCLPTSADKGAASGLSANFVPPAGIHRHLLQANATDNQTLVIADGGASYLYPTMTVRAYEVAIEQGANYLLCKLYITSDGQPICRPFLDISNSTNVGAGPAPTYQYPLADIQNLFARQTVKSRTLAFDNVFKIATPNDILDAINRSTTNTNSKPVGIVFELPPVAELLGQPDSVQSTLAVLKMLEDGRWKVSPSQPGLPLVVASTDLAALQVVKASPNAAGVSLLYKIPAPAMGAVSGNLTAAQLTQIASVASGIMLPPALLIVEENYLSLNRSVTRARWDNRSALTARAAGLDVFVHGFAKEDWSFVGPRFNGFLGDTLAMYRSLIYGPGLVGLIRGIATEWPATAATAAACYSRPVSLEYGSGLPTKRPLIMSSGGSQAIMPTQTNLSYLQAVAEGADIIDCNVQISSDKVLFCHADTKLSGRSNVEAVPELASARTTHITQGGKSVSDFWSFDMTWEQIQMVRVKQQYANRAQAFSTVVPPPSLEEFFRIAKTAPYTVGVFIKMDDPTFIGQTTTPAIDMAAQLIAFLKTQGYLDESNRYDPAVHPPLLVGSFDQCGLQALKTASGGTIPLVQKFSGGIWKEPCEGWTKASNDVHPSSWWTSAEGLDFIATYAMGINPPRALILGNVPNPTSDANAGQATQDITVGFLAPNTMTKLVTDAKARGLKVYPKVFQNDNNPGDGNQGAYDFLEDPTLEIQYYYDQLQVDAIEAQFPATVANHFESACRVGQGLPGFTPYVVQPGQLYREAESFNNTSSGGGASTGRGSSLSKGAIAGIVLGACALPLLAALVVFLLIWRRWRSRKDEERAAEMIRMETLGKHPQLKNFTYAELAVATDNFSDANRVGKGAFGTVHKATFPDGTLVAVKSLGFTISTSQKEEAAIRQLSNEVAIIGTVHNRNVVTLQGYSIDREWLLVYDFMPNGSLQDALFDPNYPIQLDWAQWFNIIVGTAKGIAYLHEECEHKIIHRDIKPANILLDSQLNARVADFGLARNTHVDETHVTTQVMGTLGYLAPEYAATGQLTEKSDTYSYGMLLIIAITGSPLIEIQGSARREAGTMVLDWVQEKAQKGSEELMSVINPKFEGNYHQEEAERWLQVALLCVQAQPGLRPAMGDVVQMLLGNKPIPEVQITRTQVVMPSSRSGSSAVGGGSTSGVYSHHSINSSIQGDDSMINFEMTQLEGR